MYTVIKIASTIALTRRLAKQFPDYHFIPVYYIGSEDHDFQELNHVYVQNEKIEWEGEAKGAFGSLSCADCQPQINSFLGRIAHLPFGEELQNIIRLAYRPEHSFAEASFTLMHELFKGTELLCIDANDILLKRSFAPVMEAEIFEECSHKALDQSIADWENKYPLALSYRAINLFYLTNEKRTRIIRNEDGTFATADKNEQWNETDLKALLRAHPERFSPNAVLRPVYQEFILPNIAFVGGGGEIAYWKQVYPVFATFKVPYPMVHLRNSIAISDKKMEKRNEQLGFDYAQWFLPEQKLIQSILDKSGIEWAKETAQLESLIETLIQKSNSIDKGLEGATGAAIAQIRKAMEGLEKKWTQAIKRKEEDQINAIKKGKQQLFPDGILQERKESFLPFYAKYGPAMIEEMITSFIATDSSQFLVINPEADD
jgi:bacillithiol biosynthesis cysteine-adding enzyme BshC